MNVTPKRPENDTTKRPENGVPRDAENGPPKRQGTWVERRLSLDAKDPTPFEDAGNFWRATSQAATIVMCVLMLGVLLYLARALILPLLCALSVSLTFGPLVGWGQRHGVPAWLSALLMVVFLIAGANIAIIMLAGPTTTLIGRAPELGAAFAAKLYIFDRPLAAFRELQAALGINPADNKTVDLNPSSLITGFLTIVTPAALQFVLQVVTFLAALFFFILGRKGFRSYAVNWFASRTARLRALKILNDIEENLGGYLIVVTAINFTLGVVTTIAAMLLGLPSPLLWGALAFVLNYVPYVGPAIMYVLLFVIGLMTYPTLLGALLPPAVYVGITLIEGQFLAPAIIGRRVLNLHPLAVFLSIAFWAWLWGPIGAFLAAPILIIARVALTHLYPRQKADLPG
ncbi:MAG TPA: AI-2E family transporter [Bradyrhizobium sp.]|nr:AI-2E family transporter [Bradyrhizobium sp.]